MITLSAIITCGADRRTSPPNLSSPSSSLSAKPFSFWRFLAAACILILISWKLKDCSGSDNFDMQKKWQLDILCYCMLLTCWYWRKLFIWDPSGQRKLRQFLFSCKPGACCIWRRVDRQGKGRGRRRISPETTFEVPSAAYLSLCIPSLVFSSIEFEATPTISSSMGFCFSPLVPYCKAISHVLKILRNGCIRLWQSLDKVRSILLLILTNEGVGSTLVACSSCKKGTS